MASNYGYIGCIGEQARLVCDVIKKSNAFDAARLILATAAAETGMGKIEDKSIYAGMGICQIDKVPFYRVRDKTDKRVKEKIKENLGIDVDLVEWEHLRYNLFLSLLFCRLYYLLVPKKIPHKIEDMAKYWKKYYNTYLGKGTTEHFMAAVESVKKEDFTEA